MEKIETEENDDCAAEARIQLWQFLLELLVDKKNSHLIKWSDDDGLFEFVHPDEVAKLWGIRKGSYIF